MDAKQIRNIATSYYANLHSAEPTSHQVKECRNLIRTHVKALVSAQINLKIITPYLVEELRKALWSLPKDSCRGEDGIPVAFFQKYWERIVKRFQVVCNEMFNVGKIPTIMAASFIYMIPKGERQSLDVSKWRSITLLNTVYTIYAKSISSRPQGASTFYHS